MLKENMFKENMVFEGNLSFLGILLMTSSKMIMSLNF